MDCKINISNGNAKPVVVVVGCLHGDELVGKKVIQKLRKIKLQKGTLITIIANERAIKAKKRFIDQDLNRSFPGKKTGNHEERLAYDLLKIVKKADFVVDIHSTTTDVKDLVIVTKSKKDVLDLAQIIRPKRIVLMRKDLAKKSFIDSCQTAVSLEYGKDGSKRTFDSSLDSVMTLLEKENMIERGNRKRKPREIDFYRMISVAKKNAEDRLKKNIKNFRLIKKGEVFAVRGKQLLAAERDFYPILFGDKAYGTIFGFRAVKG